MTGSIHVPIGTRLPARSRRRRSPTARSAPPRPARPSSISTRATRETGARPRIPDVFAAVPARDPRGARDAVINITTGGGHGMTLEERTPAARTVQARAVLAEHGEHELRPVPSARPRSRSSSTTWEPEYLERQPRLHLPQHLQGHRAAASSELGRERDPLRVRVLRRRPPLQPRALPRARAGGAAAVRADDLRHPRRDRARAREPDAHEGDGRPAVRRRLLLVGARRRAAPDESRHDRARSWAAASASASRTASTWRKGELAKSNADQVAKIVRILGELSLEIATPDETREMLALKGAGETAIPDLSAAGAV